MFDFLRFDTTYVEAVKVDTFIFFDFSVATNNGRLYVCNITTLQKLNKAPKVMYILSLWLHQ